MRSAGQQRRWLSCAAATLAFFALLGVGQVLPALHFALVAHRVCPEHGESVHADRGFTAITARTEAPFARGGADHLAAPSEEREWLAADGEHEHEHCSVLAAADSVPALAGAANIFRALPAPWSVRAPSGERAAQAGIALLAYAPKLAPPL